MCIRDRSYPFIVHVVKEGGLQHYYTVFGQIKGKLVIGDPDPSKKVIKMPLEEFAKEWTGVAPVSYTHLY